MRKVSFMIGAWIIGSVLVCSSAAQAHVLVTDESNKAGVILHITPDDNPVAGQQSTLFFDIQNMTLTASDYEVTLEITDAEGRVVGVSPTIRDGSVSAEYVFPAQGTYDITLTATPDDHHDRPLVFTQAQQVAAGNESDKVVPGNGVTWAYAGLAVAGVGAAAAMVVWFSRHRRS